LELLWGCSWTRVDKRSLVYIGIWYTLDAMPWWWLCCGSYSIAKTYFAEPNQAPWTSIQPSQHQLDIVGSSPSKFDGSEHKVLMGIVSKHRIWLWVLILYQNIESKHVLFRIQKGKPIHGNSSEIALNRPKNCPSNHIDFPIAEINCLLH
jgi:hypothetical protein